MEFIPTTTDYVALWVWVGVSVLFVFLATAVYCRWQDEIQEARGLPIALLVLTGFAAFGSVVTVWVLLAWNSGQEVLRTEAIAAEVQETYGIFPSDRDLRHLHYPAERPGAVFEEFGSFQRDDGDEAVLVWTGSEFQLGMMDGKKFTEFARD